MGVRSYCTVLGWLRVMLGGRSPRERPFIMAVDQSRTMRNMLDRPTQAISL